MNRNKWIVWVVVLTFISTLCTAQETKKTWWAKAKEKGRTVTGTNLVVLPFLTPPEQDLPLRKLILVSSKSKDDVDLKNSASQYFVKQRGVKILDRDNLKARFEEMNYQDAMVSEGAVAWGNDTGATAMIIIKVLGIEYQQQNQDTSFSEKRGFLRATVQAINLETGEKFGQKTISVEKSKFGSTFTGGAFEGSVRNYLLDKAAEEIANIFMPHVEKRSVPFKKNGNEFHQRDAYDAIDSGDIEYARELAYSGYQLALKSSGSDKKRAAACYNAGLLMLCEGRFDDAIKALRKANELDRKDLYRETQKLARNLRKNRKQTADMGF